MLASTCNKNHIHLLILCIGYSRRNCIKIQLAEPQEDIQDTDKPVLPALGGDRGGSVISFPTDDYFCLPQMAQMDTDFSIRTIGLFIRGI